ncbi:hypothetical protein [Microbacterium sp. 22242]|uniref:hypothetical protein n=1 Tax=Microbacterium sp. 22242 TaxID=3453896 RepID=UPI003F853551
MLNRIRRRLDLAVQRRIDARLEDRVADVVNPLVDARLTPVLEDVAHRQRDYDARLGGTQADFSYIRSEFDRIAPQLAALEQRFEALRVQLQVTALDEESAVARALAEHERARIRLELAAHYEERLRRLEETTD